MVHQVAGIGRAWRNDHHGLQLRYVNRVPSRISGVQIRIQGLYGQACALFRIRKCDLIGIDDGRDSTREHGQASQRLAGINAHLRYRLTTKLQHLEPATGGAQHTHHMVKNVSSHHTALQLTNQVDPCRGWNSHSYFFVDERLYQMPANPHGQRAKRPKLRNMPVEMNHECTRGCISQFRCHLMPNSFALIHGNLGMRTPISGVLVQLLFLRGDRGNHVINEQGIPTGVFDTRETKLILHLLKDDIRVSGKVIGHNKIGLCLYVVSRVHAALSTGAGQYFFCDGRTQNKAFDAIGTNTSARCVLAFKCLPQPS